jgi:hypothetical protein
MTQVAFTPKVAYAHPDALGAVYVNDTTEVNVRALFEDSTDGILVFDEEADAAAIAKLDAYEPLKRVAVPQPKAATPAKKSASPDGGG